MPAVLSLEVNGTGDKKINNLKQNVNIGIRTLTASERGCSR